MNLKYLIFLIISLVLIANGCINDFNENLDINKTELIKQNVFINNFDECFDKYLDINKTNHYAENEDVIYVGGDGNYIYLENNPNATDPSYNELIKFIKKDRTDLKLYDDNKFVCGDYAELVHNNAENNGIKTAWVVVSFYDDSYEHALNGFNTTDKGFIYIDSTGTDTITPCSYDRIIGIKIGKPMWYYEITKCDGYYYPPFVSSKVKNIEIFW